MYFKYSIPALVLKLVIQNRTLVQNQWKNQSWLNHNTKDYHSRPPPTKDYNRETHKSQDKFQTGRIKKKHLFSDTQPRLTWVSPRSRDQGELKTRIHLDDLNTVYTVRMQLQSVAGPMYIFRYSARDLEERERNYWMMWSFQSVSKWGRR